MRLAALAIVAACAAPAPTRPLVENRGRPPLLEAAENAAFGRGEPRDYRKAARLADELCAQGCGDLAACHFCYVRLVRPARGIRLGPDGQAALAARLCARGVSLACVDLSRPTATVDQLADRCAQSRDVDACEAFTAAKTDASQHEEASHVGCELGVFDSCSKPLSESELARVSASCKAGDADACRFLPDPGYSHHELCRAGDRIECLFAHEISVDESNQLDQQVWEAEHRPELVAAACP